MLSLGFPIRTSPDHRLLASPRGFSQLATSFFASLRLGIHTHALSSLTIKLTSSLLLLHYFKHSLRSPGSPCPLPPPPALAAGSGAALQPGLVCNLCCPSISIQLSKNSANGFRQTAGIIHRAESAPFTISVFWLMPDCVYFSASRLDDHQSKKIRFVCSKSKIFDGRCSRPGEDHFGITAFA